ncbi:alpha/beta hydrolase [uncultured Eudoraea sp.]|uniref:alpha/beta hydrolase n=1 Tax=uncultured Eudoraea sp. TaxID=1035614 RepID=UPI002603636D|nr:alpha/beta hydrolase [uncultured Eudoraea sp.]
MKTKIFFACFSLLLIMMACQPVDVNNNEGSLEKGVISDKDISLYNYASQTISPEAKEIINAFTSAKSKPHVPLPEDKERWKTVQHQVEIATKDQNEAFIAQLGLKVTELNLGGIPVLDIKPNNWKDNGKVLVYTHGGAYVLFSALSTINVSGQTAQATGCRVIAIDYTLAPHAKWLEISDEIITVFKELLKEGYTMAEIGLFGDSAGGGLASTTALRLRDEGFGLPAAVVLYSPMGDLSCPGESFQTLKAAEGFYDYKKHIKPSFKAYADTSDYKNPYVSSIYGDFNKGYAPTLIQGGTKELLLSSFVRLYQAMDIADVDVKLDIYEGMPHVFQRYSIPETEIALNKVNDFFKEHLIY